MKMCVCVCVSLLGLLHHRPEGLHDHVGLVDELDGTHIHVYHSGVGEEKENTRHKCGFHLHVKADFYNITKRRKKRESSAFPSSGSGKKGPNYSWFYE